MSRLGTFVFGAIVGAGLCYGSLKYHVLRTNEGFQFIPKIAANFSDIYLDVRNFKPDDWSKHKPLVAAVVQAGKGSIMGEGEANAIREEAKNVIDRFAIPPQSRY